LDPQATGGVAADFEIDPKRRLFTVGDPRAGIGGFKAGSEIGAI